MLGKSPPSALWISVLVLLPASACIGSVEDVELDLFAELDVPDVLGDWVLSPSHGVHPDATYESDTASAVCDINAFGVSLDRGDADIVGIYHVSGSHTGFEMLCRGITSPASAIFGMSDTAVVVPPGDVTGTLAPQCRFLGGCWWALDLWGGNFCLSNVLVTRIWSGTLWWPAYAYRMHAHFTAEREPGFAG